MPAMVLITVVENGVISGVRVKVGSFWLASIVGVDETGLGVNVADGTAVFAQPDKTKSMIMMLRIFNDTGFK